MKTDEIRERYLNFFKARDHKIVKSDSLVPQNDPTLLFTGAGMNQFKEYFLGIKKDLRRAASSQKCLRSGDLDQVGRTPYHHSFFEMLGNFSFGDYFKKEAIQWAWEFLVQEMKLPKERLRVSVHRKDDEAFKIWRDQIKIREDWIYKMDDKTNFWPADAPAEGPNGPCGPCSEIYFDQTPSAGTGSPIDDDSGRYAEIWNLVFTQYDRQETGRLVPLAAKNIDTGMGLERLACVMQGRKTNYEIDIFKPVNQAVTSNLNYKGETSGHIYAISDHVRAVVFAIADGVIPSNEGRGYVIRKLIRRALWRAHQLIGEIREPFLFKVAPTVLEVMKNPYPDLSGAAGNIHHTLEGEERRFLDTLEKGFRILGNRISELKKKREGMIPGEVVFELYDTYGFPEELTQAIAHEQGLEIDRKGRDRLMESQRKRAKEASQIAGSIFVTTELEKRLSSLPSTKFLGYDTLESSAKIDHSEVKNDKGVIVLNETPFYAESGGQVGDRGTLKAKNFEAHVMDTQRKDEYILHYVEIVRGTPKVGDLVTASVDPSRRERTMRNHTATHLLHAALRGILGAQVRQLGSLVAPEKLRFDYSYAKPLAPEQIRQIEDAVNSEILKDTAVIREEKPTEEAKGEGAIAFFGEKYGERVRVVTVPGFSKEFCGGTHCGRTGQIGSFVITSDGSIASGVRRIEALTGEGAMEYMQRMRLQIQQASEKLKATPAELTDRIEKLQERVKRLEKESGVRDSHKMDPKELLEKAKKVGPYRVIMSKMEGLKREILRKIHDQLRSQARQALWILFSKVDGRIHYLIGCSADLKLADVRKLNQSLTPKIKASGGGRADLVEGGSSEPELLEAHWEEIKATTVAYTSDLAGKS